MRRFMLLVLLFALLGGCAANKEQLPENEEYVPEKIFPEDWARFYIAVYNEEDDVIAEFMDLGFDIDLYQEDLTQSLYYEIYHSIQGFVSRYVDGPLDPETEAEYEELEQSLIGLCKRLKDVGLKPEDPGDLISAATFREFPALVEWLSTEFSSPF